MVIQSQPDLPATVPVEVRCAVVITTRDVTP